MPHWSSLTFALFAKKSTSNPTTSNHKMITPESPSEVNVQLERTASIPITPSQKQTPVPAHYRSIDPSQTLQVPFHESQKAETPFINPLGESMIIATPPSARSSIHTKVASFERRSPSTAVAATKPRCVPEAVDEKDKWQDGWMTIVELEKGMEKENFGLVKKRSTKEWRTDEVEPLKKKPKDHGRSLWAKRSRAEVGSVRMGCT